MQRSVGCAELRAKGRTPKLYSARQLDGHVLRDLKKTVLRWVTDEECRLVRRVEQSESVMEEGVEGLNAVVRV